MRYTIKLTALMSLSILIILVVCSAWVSGGESNKGVSVLSKIENVLPDYPIDTMPIWKKHFKMVDSFKAGNYLYVIDWTKGLYIFDATNPFNPALINVTERKCSK